MLSQHAEDGDDEAACDRISSIPLHHHATAGSNLDAGPSFEDLYAIDFEDDEEEYISANEQPEIDVPRRRRQEFKRPRKRMTSGGGGPEMVRSLASRLLVNAGSQANISLLLSDPSSLNIILPLRPPLRRKY